MRPRRHVLWLFLAVVVLAPRLASATVYHATTTGSPAGDGSTQSPYDLATALTVMTPGDAVYIANGSYAWTEAVSGLIPIRDNCVIEGGFDSGSWTKSPSPGTTITIASMLRDHFGIGYHVGLEATSRSGFTFRDLSLILQPQGATGTLSQLGISMYGVHLVGCSNYSFVRVSVSTGAASDGEAGIPGADGAPGGLGGPGIADDPATWGCGTGGAGGMTGGGGWTAPATTCNESGSAGVPASQRMGAGGGAGGGGGKAFAGSAGVGGAGGAIEGGNPAAGGGGAAPRVCSSTVNDGTSGGGGATGHSGSGYAPDVRVPIDASQRGTYFIPGDQGQNGEDGKGGGGGAGGGGGGCAYADAGSCQQYPQGDGAGGGGGGGGGEGGAGGTGGYPGGSAYAVYLVSNGANTAFSCSNLAPGHAGFGGSGGTGGTGGARGVGYPGGAGHPGSGRGGDGRAGGAGGAGGRGQDGPNGESVGLLLVSGTPPTVSQSGCEVLAVDDDRSPIAFALHASQPNPASSFSRIAYDVTRDVNVTVDVFDAQGRAVRMLASGMESAGRKTLSWDLRDDSGTHVRAGIYFYRFTADRFEALQRVIVLE